MVDVGLEYLNQTVSTPGQFAAPPLDSAGGSAALSPGNEQWIDLNLQPGDYLLACFIPDLTNRGKPHFTEGMHLNFHKS